MSNWRCCCPALTRYHSRWQCKQWLAISNRVHQCSAVLQHTHTPTKSERCRLAGANRIISQPASRGSLQAPGPDREPLGSSTSVVRARQSTEPVVILSSHFLCSRLLLLRTWRGCIFCVSGRMRCQQFHSHAFSGYRVKLTHICVLGWWCPTAHASSMFGLLVLCFDVLRNIFLPSMKSCRYIYNLLGFCKTIHSGGIYYLKLSNRHYFSSSVLWHGFNDLGKNIYFKQDQLVLTYQCTWLVQHRVHCICAVTCIFY